MPTVADLTVDELIDIIRESVREVLLELRPEMIELLSQPEPLEGRVRIEDLAAKQRST